MIQELRGDSYPIDVMRALGKILILDVCSQLAKFHREVCIFHLAGQHIGKRAVAALGTADSEAITWYEQRSEERETLNMIPVSMSEKDGGFDRPRRMRHPVVAEYTRSSAAIENKALSGLGLDFDAGCVAAEMVRPHAGSGYRSSRAPETQSHCFLQFLTGYFRCTPFGLIYASVRCG